MGYTGAGWREGRARATRTETRLPRAVPEGRSPKGMARGGRVEVRGGPNLTRLHAPPEHSTMPTPQGL